MIYKEFKEKINKIANDYNLNLKVTEDAANIYIKMGESICAYTKKALLGFASTDFESMYFLNEKPRVKILKLFASYRRHQLRKDKKKRNII